MRSSFNSMPAWRERFRLYTLACNHYSRFRRELWDCAAADRYDTFNDCELHFASAMLEFMGCQIVIVNPATLNQAATYLDKLLEVVEKKLAQSNNRAAEIFSTIRQQIQNNIHTWRLEVHLNQCIDNANMGGIFLYSNSPWPHTQNRFDISRIEWRIDHTDDPKVGFTDFDSPAIVIRVTPTSGYKLCLYMQLWFLNEICSHVIADDNMFSHPQFTDGWLTFVTTHLYYKFMKTAFDDKLGRPLSARFIGDVQDQLPQVHQKTWDKMLKVKRQFDEISDRAFMDITYELMAFTAPDKISQNWPDKLIQKIFFASEHPTLLKKNVRTAIANVQANNQLTLARSLDQLLPTPPRSKPLRDIWR